MIFIFKFNPDQNFPNNYNLSERLYKKMFKFIILSLVVVLSLGEQSVPIPSHPDGLSLNSNVNSFVLEAHYESFMFRFKRFLLCFKKRAEHHEGFC